jgi:phospholipid-binding lipoprotein MlaA
MRGSFLLLLFLIGFLGIQGSLFATESKALDKKTEKNSEDSNDELLEELNSTSIKYDYEKLDPFVKYNKNIFSLNMFLFRNTILPFIFLVDAWVPKPITNGYRNFMKNLLEPSNYIIHLLRHDKKRMQLTAKRFFINTIFGMLGLADVSGMKYKNYSKTMGFDCAFKDKNKSGRYIIVPIANQYYERELTSNTFDWLLNPIFYLNFPLTYILYGVDQLILLAPNKNLIYKYRKYSEDSYALLREMQTHNAFDKDSCIG